MSELPDPEQEQMRRADPWLNAASICTFIALATIPFMPSPPAIAVGSALAIAATIAWAMAWRVSRDGTSASRRRLKE